MFKEYIFGKLCDSGLEKVREWMNKDKAQQLLLKAFESYHDKQKCIVDKKEILSVNTASIKPNYRAERIVANLRDVFDKCVVTDDKYERARIEIQIAYEYLKMANSELLSLVDLDEDIHQVEDEVKENRRIINDNHREVTVEMKKMQNMLKAQSPRELQFLPELKESKVYCYLHIITTTIVDDDVIEEMISRGMGAEFEPDFENGFDVLYIYFFEPLKQSELKDFLENLDEVFVMYDIGIFNIYTH